MPFLVSFALTALLTPIVIALARRVGWIDKPRADRWHRKPTALMGGIAIFLGALAGWMAFVDRTALDSFLVPAVAIFLLGVLDDRIGLKPHLKLIGQVAAAVWVAQAVRFEGLPPLLSLPIVMLWMVGITNAINLLDNMDGLAAGVSAISGLAMAVLCALDGDQGLAAALLALVGACAGFLIYNFNPAKVFMGDCGSMFLGFSLASLALYGSRTGASSLAISLLVPVAILAIPIFDTTLVSIVRTLHGRSISQGGRDHSSHRLVALGLSERGTVLVLYGLTGLFGGVALLSKTLAPLAVCLIATVLFVVLLLLGIFLGFLKVYPEEAQVPPRIKAIGGTLLYKRQLLQVLLDMVLIPVAFIGAHLLRYEGAPPMATAEVLPEVLPMVLVAKLLSMALCRGYGGVWRHAGMDDALRAGTGSTVGSLLSAALLMLTGVLPPVSRAALVIDWLLFSVLAAGVRLGYAALVALFARVSPQNSPRVVILGAGPQGLSLVQELRHPLALQRAEVVGILDDDRSKHGRLANGVPILGPLSMLPELIDAQGVNRCVLGVAADTEAGRSILALCREKGIALGNGHHRDRPEALSPSAARQRHS
ncbi:MAG: hypothetical protein HY321_06560 [Armatimonadetes bacterium]|nr:hypothetical protein [Armatimonadota bacterium]